MKTFLYIFSLLIVISCETERINNSIFYLDDFEAIDIGYPYGSIVYEGSYDGTYHSINKELINSTVMNVIETKHYLLVKQKFDKALIKKQVKDKLEQIKLNNDSIEFPHGKMSKNELNNLKYYDFQSKKINKDKITIIVDSIVKNEPYYTIRILYPYNYYIVNQQTKEIIGPLSELLFQQKIRELKISEDITDLIKLHSDNR